MTRGEILLISGCAPCGKFKLSGGDGGDAIAVVDVCECDACECDACESSDMA